MQGVSEAFIFGDLTAFHSANGTGNATQNAIFSANLSNAIFGSSSTVQSPAFQILMIIKS